MLVRGSRVGIIGGSIAGCATAIALERLGCDAQVFERSTIRHICGWALAALQPSTSYRHNASSRGTEMRYR